MRLAQPMVYIHCVSESYMHSDTLRTTHRGKPLRSSDGSEPPALRVDSNLIGYDTIRASGEQGENEIRRPRTEHDIA